MKSDTQVKPNIKSELDWIRTIFLSRLKQYFGDPISENGIYLEPPPLGQLSMEYRNILETYEASPTERIVLGLSLAPHLDPSFITDIISSGVSKEGDFPIIGCVKGKNHRGFLPTGETALFLIAGADVEKRIDAQKIFTTDHWLFQKHMIKFENVAGGEPKWSGIIVADEELVELITTGKVSKPVLGSDFPAKYISTEMEWRDLVLNNQVLEQIGELELWLKHNKELMDDWGMSRKIRPGYRVLFHGPPGTGKTLTATLLGKYTHLPVFKVDLSLIVSKYIGETEKNLSSLFSKAENKNWILFFDEADALFGKRTEQRDAHDRHANQEVAYLLQRVEDYPGLVILASNFKSNIDPAFTRRFQSMIHFPMPKQEERFKLWKMAFPKQIKISKEIDWTEIAKTYQVSGSNIMNIVQYCCIQTLEEKARILTHSMLLKGIKREYEKEDRMM